MKDLDDLSIVNTIFSSIGSCEGQIDENLLNVVTALSGSGPAYVRTKCRLFLIDLLDAVQFSVMVEALADGAVKAGLSRSMALTLAVKTMLGTAKMLLDQEHQFHPSQLKDAVASPGSILLSINQSELIEYRLFQGGTTIYGLEMMEKAGVRAALMETITAATNRAAQLESWIFFVIDWWVRSVFRKRNLYVNRRWYENRLLPDTTRMDIMKTSELRRGVNVYS